MENEQNLEMSENKNNVGNNQKLDPKKNKKNKVIIIAAVITILLAIVIVVYLFFISKPRKIDNPSSSSSSSKISDIKKNDYIIATWNNTKYLPKKLFFDTSNDSLKTDPDYISDFEYYNIATLTNGSTLVRVTYLYPLDSSIGFRHFLVDKNDNVTCIKYPFGTNKIIRDPGSYLADFIKTDYDIFIKDMIPKKTITYDGVTFNFDLENYWSISLPNPNFDKENLKSEIEQLQTYDQNIFYKETIYLNDYIYTERYYSKNVNDNLLYEYNDNSLNFKNDNGTLNAIWDSKLNENIYFNNPFLSNDSNNDINYYIKDYDSTKEIKIGELNVTNKPIYKLTNDLLLRIFYDAYCINIDNDILSYDDYKNQLTNIVFQEPKGNWRVLSSGEYLYSARADKPVIYLYPEKSNYIDVFVDATITASDPTYPSGGWKNVFANPSGQLTYKQEKYDYLFWEGIGSGRYPYVKNIGKLVLQDNLIKNIEEDLKVQGLIEKEITDFMDFWSNHLPKEKYVRLSWLTTEQMNELAPLRVNPTPDTVIRVFLDMKGYNEPIKLTPQKLTKNERKGFTLVEWGGQLIK